MKRKLAIIEDNEDNLLLVNAILEDFYDLTAYKTGQEALLGLQQERPDLVLLDISLPGMDGTQVIRQIRAAATLRDLPVIALTAHAMVGDREALLAAGFDEYVTKPIVDEQVLLDAIVRLLAGAGSV